MRPLCLQIGNFSRDLREALTWPRPGGDRNEGRGRSGFEIREPRLMQKLLMGARLLAILTASPALAQEQPGGATAPGTDASPASDAAQPQAPQPASAGSAIVVTGRRLDLARDAITPSLGASQYTFDREALEKQPGGTNLTLNKSLLQAPGVVQDSYGVIHVRNEHANLQYRLNGVIVPESISGFGTTFDP